MLDNTTSVNMEQITNFQNLQTVRGFCPHDYNFKICLNREQVKNCISTRSVLSLIKVNIEYSHGKHHSLAYADNENLPTFIFVQSDLGCGSLLYTVKLAIHPHVGT